jgi:hypothetical protein
MQIHALQTGRVRVKRAQIVGQGHGSKPNRQQHML